MRQGFLTVPPKRLDPTTARPTVHVVETNRLTTPEFVPIPSAKIRGLKSPESYIPDDFRAFDYDWIPRPAPGTFSGEVPPFCVLYSGTREAILALPNFPKPLMSPPSLTWPFYIKDIPGMGKAMVARTPIQAGQLILNEHPLIVYPTAFPYYTHPTLKPEERDFMQLSVNLLWGPSKKMFYSLHNVQGSEMMNTKGIFAMNALGIGELPGPYKGDHSAICHFLSRMNHR
jgi:hypothetical protein